MKQESPKPVLVSMKSSPTMTKFYNIAKQKYLAGDELTLVDLFHLPNGSALKAFGYKGTFEKYPNVDKWFTGLQERETWVKAAALAVMAA